MGGRLDQLGVLDPFLTGISLGFADNDYIGEQLFPIINSKKMKGTYYKFGDEQFIHYSMTRAVGAKSLRKQTDLGTKAEYRLDQYSLEELIDDLEDEESDILDLKIHLTEITAKNQLHAMEMEHARVATDLNMYNGDNKETLSDDYFNEASIDWIEILDNKKSVIKSMIAKNPNTLVIPEPVWNKLKNHDLLKRYLMIGTEKNLLPTPEDLGKVLGFNKVLIPSAVNKTTDGLVDIWGNNLIMAYVDQPSDLGSSDKKPSFGYTWRKEGQPEIRVYRDETVQSDVILSNNAYKVDVVSNTSGFIIKNPIDPAVINVI